LIVTKKLNVEFKGSSDCVFAYQLIKIRPKKNNKFNEEDCNKGALMGEDREVQDHRVEGLHEDWEIDTVDVGPPDAADTPEVIVYEENIE
jgi:hypothetical protein